MKKLIINRVQCLLCEDIITSEHSHDFKTCKRANVEIYRLTVEMNIQDGFIRNIIHIKIYPNLQKQKNRLFRRSLC